MYIKKKGRIYEEQLWERIEILEQGGVISQKVAQFSKKVTDIMLAELEHPKQDKMEMFITHLAMAGKRAEEGTEENPIKIEICWRV